MSPTFNPALFKEKLKTYVNGDYFRTICREKHRRLLLESLREIKSKKEILRMKKLVCEPNIPNILSSSESEPEEDTTNDHKPVSDDHFRQLVAEMTGVLDQLYIELPRNSQKMIAKALLYDLEVPSPLLATWNIGI